MITMPGENPDSPGNWPHYNLIDPKAKILFLMP
jgi:hypothetical protein